MLSNKVWLAGLSIFVTYAWVTLAVKVNDINTQYIISSFNFDEFPMAVGVCNPTDVALLDGYQMAECVSESEIVLTSYSDAACTDSELSTTFNDSYQTGLGWYGDFNCDDDAVAAYADIAFTTTDCEDQTAYFVNFKAAVATCTFLGVINPSTTSYYSIQAWCNETNAELQYFDASDNFDIGYYAGDCSGDTVNIAFAEEECSYLLTTGPFTINGYLEECYLGVDTGDSSSGDDDDDVSPSSTVAVDDDDDSESSDESNDFAPSSTMMNDDSDDDSDSHDDSHDSHTCHYGYLEGFGFPFVEDECSYTTSYVNDTTFSQSYKFECSSDGTYGRLYIYSFSSNCSGDTQYYNDITNDGSFDCTTEGECDVVKLSIGIYGSDDSDCSGDLTAMAQVYSTSNSECIKDTNTSWVSITDIEDGSFVWSNYTDNMCSDVDTAVTIVDGCYLDPFRSNVYSNFVIEVEESSDDDDDDDSSSDDETTDDSGANTYKHGVIFTSYFVASLYGLYVFAN